MGIGEAAWRAAPRELLGNGACAGNGVCASRLFEDGVFRNDLSVVLVDKRAPFLANRIKEKVEPPCVC